MKLKNTFRNSKKALIPAIAVALLLAITIALVAAVGYAVSTTTPTTSSQKPISATFDVTISKAAGSFFYGDMRIRQLSGDPVDTANLKLTFTAQGVTTTITPGENNTFYLESSFPQDMKIKSDADRAKFFAAPKADPDVPYPADSDPAVAHVWLAVNNQETGQALPIQATTDGTTWVDAVPTGRTTPVLYDVFGHPEVYVEYLLPELTGGSTYKLINVTSTSTGKIVSTAISVWDASIGLDNGQGIILHVAEYCSPWLWDIATGNPSSNPALNFGEYSLSPGLTARAIGTSYLANPTDDINSVISNWSSLKSGDVVKVAIVSTGNGQILWQGDVIVG
ncbi:MAG: type IV pilin [Candidatus Bathyarchaeota archaeon]|nr:type IV pilin [Candidatus Bathyarchaeota archaeon]